LGSILKEADLVFSVQERENAANRDIGILNMFLLPNRQKRSKLYNRDFEKPSLYINRYLSENGHIAQIYKNIEVKVEQKRHIKPLQQEIPAAEWESIKLGIE
jgi:hypothetical protein